MKKILFSLLALCTLCTTAMAENAIEAKRFKQWGRQYLTLTNNWDGLLCTTVSGELPPVLSLITSINGQSTDDMSAETFSKIVSQSSDITLEYIEKDNGVNHNKKCVLSTKKNYFIESGLNKTPTANTPNTISLSSDSEIDFFNYNTFDFSIGEDDKLTDKDIAEALSKVFESRGLKRTSDNPDLIFKFSKRYNQNSNSTYVPEQRQVVNTGANTYTWKDRKGNVHANTVVNNSVVTSGGYTKTTNTSELHLLLQAYDGNKLRENPQSNPLVWQLDFNDFYQYFTNMLALVKNNVSYWARCYPFNKQMYSYSVSTRGIVFKNQEDMRTGEIVDVLEGTDAYEKGLRAGQKIMKVYKGGSYLIFWLSSKTTYFKADSYKEKNKAWTMAAFYIPIPIPFPRSVTNHPYDYLTPGLGNNNINGAQLHYIVKSPDGSEFDIRTDGFKNSFYNYEYIY